jgi:2-amino-4-hydroxy-6-hydroxymethyldihydropteridine diphosphokinase
MPPVAIALGSNLGDRRAHLTYAVEQLAAILTDIRVSTFIETDPVDVDGPQPPFLNGVVVGETTLPAETLLRRLLALERARGRKRPAPKAPRTLDLDLILYGSERISSRDLIVPHPRYRTRAFVLEPLAEVAPDWVDPETGETVAEVLKKGTGFASASQARIGGRV